MDARREFLLCFIIAALATAIYIAPALKKIGHWGDLEFIVQLPTMAAQVDCIVKHGELPFWTPYEKGGVPVLANPKSMFLSPFFLLFLATDPIVGLKLRLFGHIVLALMSSYYLARYLGINRAASALVAVLYSLNGRSCIHFAVGNFEHGQHVFFPLVLYLYLRFVNERRNNLKFLLLGAACCAWVSFDGAVYYYAYLYLLLGILTVAHLLFFQGTFLKASSRRDLVSKFIIFVVASLALASVKLLPSYALLRKYPRPTVAPGIAGGAGYTSASMLHAFVNRNQQPRVIPGQRCETFPYLFFDHSEYWNWEEYGAYVGPLPFIVGASAFVYYARSRAELIVPALYLLSLTCSDRSWVFLHEFPIFCNMRGPARFIILFLFCAVLLIGHVISDFIPSRSGQHILFLVVLLLFADLCDINSLVLKDAFTSVPTLRKPSPHFSQVKNYEDNELNCYFANEGVTSMFSDLPYPCFATGRDEKGYRGEVYLKNNGGEAKIAHMSHNRFVVDLKVKGDDVLVLNQNCMEGWYVSGSLHNSLYAHKGLVATRVSSCCSRVTFYYVPPFFLLGLVISISSAFGLIIWCYRKKHL